MENTPASVPTKLLARCDLKNEPWPQSCRMMKMRIRKPPASTATGRPSQYEKVMSQ